MPKAKQNIFMAQLVSATQSGLSAVSNDQELVEFIIHELDICARI